ncbi:DMT family transporter [Candidatus Woesearchaeota archaeon]|nr:DMT family transporter [Candidatus Woesearchaeota archaeon]
MVIPFFAAVGGAVNMVLSKKVLSKHKMSYKLFLAITTAILFLMCLILSPFLIAIHPGALVPVNVFLLIFVGVLSFIYNLLFFHGLQEESLNETETVWMFLPLLIVILSLIFYPAERNYYIFIPALISGAALILSHIKRHHVDFSRGAHLILLSVVVAAFEAIFIRYLLDFYNPFSLYFVRIGIAAILMWLYAKPHVGKVKSKSWLYIIILSVFVLIQFIFTYWSYAVNGLVYTMLILNLLPVMIFAYAWTLGKERFEWKKFLAAIVILGCVIAVQILGH